VTEEKSADEDWRLSFCDHLKGQAFRLKKWQRPSYNSEWDHDHCSACWKRIWDQADGADSEEALVGYASLATERFADDYNWVCVECFADLAKSQDWLAVENNN
jgi:hypothetical protein